MLLKKVMLNDVPRDGRIISEQEALKLRWATLHTWKKTSEVFPLTFGPLSLGLATLATGYYFTSYYRRKFKVTKYRAALGYAGSLIPLALQPLFHWKFVASDILLEKSCLICTHTKAVAFQLSGYGFSLLAGYVSSHMMAYELNSYPIPLLTLKKWREQIHLWRAINWRITKKIGVGALIHLSLTTLLLSWEYKAYENVLRKLEERKKDVKKALISKKT